MWGYIRKIAGKIDPRVKNLLQSQLNFREINGISQETLILRRKTDCRVNAIPEKSAENTENSDSVGKIRLMSHRNPLETGEKKRKMLTLEKKCDSRVTERLVKSERNAKNVDSADD